MSLLPRWFLFHMLTVTIIRCPQGFWHQTRQFLRVWKSLIALFIGRLVWNSVLHASVTCLKQNDIKIRLWSLNFIESLHLFHLLRLNLRNKVNGSDL